MAERTFTTEEGFNKTTFHVKAPLGEIAEHLGNIFADSSIPDLNRYVAEVYGSYNNSKIVADATVGNIKLGEIILNALSGNTGGMPDQVATVHNGKESNPSSTSRSA